MKTEEIGRYIIFQKFVGKWKSQNLKTHEVRGSKKSRAQYQWGEIKPPRSESLARKYQRFTRSVCDVTYGIACQLVLWFTGVATSFSASAVRGELGVFFCWYLYRDCWQHCWQTFHSLEITYHKTWCNFLSRSLPSNTNTQIYTVNTVKPRLRSTTQHTQEHDFIFILYIYLS